jgi:hypothetical protein
MPQVDHRVGKGFEGVVQLTDALKAKQQAPELVFPGKQPLESVLFGGVAHAGRSSGAF